MANNLILMTRHDERLDENDTGPTEYPLTKLSNLTFHRRLTTCKIHHSNDVLGSNKGFRKNTQFMFNTTMLFQTNMDKNNHHYTCSLMAAE